MPASLSGSFQGNAHTNDFVGSTPPCLVSRKHWPRQRALMRASNHIYLR
jgi:hypothetical protein